LFLPISVAVVAGAPNPLYGCSSPGRGIFPIWAPLDAGKLKIFQKQNKTKQPGLE